MRFPAQLGEWTARSAARVRGRDAAPTCGLAPTWSSRGAIGAPTAPSSICISAYFASQEQGREMVTHRSVDAAQPRGAGAVHRATEVALRRELSGADAQRRRAAVLVRRRRAAGNEPLCREGANVLERRSRQARSNGAVIVLSTRRRRVGAGPRARRHRGRRAGALAVACRGSAARIDDRRRSRVPDRAIGGTSWHGASMEIVQCDDSHAQAWNALRRRRRRGPRSTTASSGAT